MNAGAAPHWLSALPRVEPQPLDGASLRGLMLRSPTGRVRLLIDDQLIELARQDVDSVQTLPAPDGLRPGAAVHVRLWLRPGARLLTAGGTHGLVEQLFSPQQPFAVAVRDADLTVTPSGEYARLETEYLRRHSLEEPT